MFILGGRPIIVELTDGSTITATTRFTWGSWLRLRNATAYLKGQDTGTVPDVLVPLSAVLTVRFVPRA